MIPLSLLAVQKLMAKLTAGDALANAISAMATGMDVLVPRIAAEQIVLSSAAPDLTDMRMQLTYPRVCIYSAGSKNSQLEKFRSFSGQVTVVAEVWSSASLLDQVEKSIHYYVEGVARLLQNAVGDWGDGVFYPGGYDVHFNPPKPGGAGFVQSARLSFNLAASVSQESA